MKKNRIYLFEWTPRNLMSLLIRVATGCPFTHAAIEVCGVLYDASESRGTFDRADIAKLHGRPCQVCEFGGDLSGWVELMRGKRYDYAGVLGWLVCRWIRIGCGDRKKFYCFEAANAALRFAGFRGALCEGAVSGCDVRHAFVGGTRYLRFGVSGGKHDRP